MTLSCENPFTQHRYGVGIIIRKVKIADVADVSGETAPFLERPWDIGIKLFLEVGRGFQPELTIAGNLKKDPQTGEVIGWGSGFVVQEALRRLGYSGNLEEGNRIPLNALEEMVGKEFYRLSYVSGRKDSGKLRYSDWNQIAAVEEGADDLASRFRRSLSRGYPKQYRPDLILDGSIAPTTNAVDETMTF